jgi:hypothetical protein
MIRCNDFFPDPEELRNFSKSFSGFMKLFKILKIVLGLPKEVSGSGRSLKVCASEKSVRKSRTHNFLVLRLNMSIMY